MKKALSLLFVVLIVAVSFGSALAYEAIVGPTGVLKYDKEKSYGGYTLFSPMIGCKTAYLIDMEGDLVHKWDTEYTPGFYAMLLPNGNLLRGGVPKGAPCAIGGTAGLVQELDWNGKVVWEYKMLSPTEVHHHCFDRMPNGNTLILGWEYKSIDEAIAKGRDPKTIPITIFDRGMFHKGFWVDFVREVDASISRRRIIFSSTHGMFNMIHRSYRYGADYPGLKGKDLSNKVPLTDCPKFFEIYKTDVKEKKK